MIFNKIKEYAALTSGDFNKMFKGLEVPPLPKAAVRLLELIRQGEAHLEEISMVIESDTGLAVQVLRVVNTAMFGIPGQVSSIKKAVSILGLKSIEKIVTAQAVIGAVENPHREGFDQEAFWSDALFRALAAREIASLAGMEEDEAFLGGLLQDIAIPVLLKDWWKSYGKVFAKARNEGRRLSSVEQEMLSWDHAQAAAWMAAQWQLPEILICCVGVHVYDIEALVEMGLDKGAPAAVCLSSLIPSSLSPEPDFVPLARESAKLGLSKSQLMVVLEKSRNLFQQTAQTFGIKNGIGSCFPYLGQERAVQLNAA